MILKFKSTNDYFLSILYKKLGVNNGIALVENKNGYIVGNCISNNEYHAFFHDTKYSYNEDMSNMLDQQSLSNPRIGLDINNELFKHLLLPKETLLETVNTYTKLKFSEIDNLPCSISVSNVYIDSNWVKGDSFLLFKYFKEFTKFKHISGKQYSFDIEANSVIEAVNLASFAFLMMTVTNEQNFYIHSDLIQKYIRIMNNIGNMPYFVIYLFKVRALFSNKIFNVNKKALEALFPNLELTMHNNHMQRLELISDMFKVDSNDILDFGCGELKYFKKLSSLLKDDRNYYAVDIDDYKDYLLKLSERSKFKSSFYNNIKDIDFVNKTTVISSEVIEHMGVDIAKSELEYLMSNENVDKLIISTPNKDFNIHYQMDVEMRHVGHLVELTELEFKNFISSLSGVENYDVEFSGIGDYINKSQPTSLVVLKRK